MFFSLVLSLFVNSLLTSYSIEINSDFLCAVTKLTEHIAYTMGNNFNEICLILCCTPEKPTIESKTNA